MFQKLIHKGMKEKHRNDSPSRYVSEP